MMTRRAVPRYFLYGEAIQDTDDRFLHIESIAERCRLHNWMIEPHAHHELHHLLLLLRGGGNFQADGNLYDLVAPALVAVPLACVHSFRMQPDTEGWVITNSASMIRRIVGHHPELVAAFSGAAVLPLSPASANALADVVRDLGMEVGAQRPVRHIAVEALLVTVLVCALRQKICREPISPTRTPDSVLVTRYRELVEAKYGTKFGIAQYASRLRVSSDRLRSACIRCTGSSPIALLNARRLLEAKRCLRYTDMSVALIAEACGFEDPAYFSRFFAHHIGRSARAYRLERQP